MVFGAIAMRNYDIEFDRFDQKLHFTQANCSKNWDPNLNPKHKNRNILQEVSEPRILDDAKVSLDSNFSDSQMNVSFNNVTNVSDKANNTNSIVEDDDEETRSNSNNFLHSFLVITEN